MQQIGEVTAVDRRAGGSFVAGLVLHTGATAAPFGDRIAAVPMDIVWTA